MVMISKVFMKGVSLLGVGPHFVYKKTDRQCSYLQLLGYEIYTQNIREILDMINPGAITITPGLLA